MQKFLSLIVVLCLSLAVNAQPFFENVAYRGAFSTTNWASGWSNWDPQNTSYPTSTSLGGRNLVNFSGDISGNVTWNSNDLVIGSGAVHVLDGASLTIQAGCVVRGNLGNRFTIIVSRGGKIYANGTSANPIVFTSGAPVGQRVRGDWGGVLLLGRASTNNSAGVNAKYEALPSDPLAQFGGSNDNDNSGVMTYCRIEYAGFNYLPGQEINGLTFAGVGRGTDVHHIQVSYGLDDSYEWFGGTTNHKYLIAFAGTDDEFDGDMGYRGQWQYFLGVRNAGVYETDVTGSSNGFEIDNNTNWNNAGVGESNAGTIANGQGELPSPVTKVIASNITLVGPVRFGETGAAHSARFNRAFETRTGAKVSVFNSIVTGYPQGIRAQNLVAASTKNTLTWNRLDTVRYVNNIFATTTSPDGYQSIGTALTTSGYAFSAADFLTKLNANGNVRIARNAFTFVNGTYTGNPTGDLDQLNYSTVNFALTSGSTALTGAADLSLNTYYNVMGGRVISGNTPVVAVAASANNVCAGTNVTFTTAVSNGTATSYQWTKNGTNISGATTSSLTTSSFVNNDVIACKINGSVASNGITMVVATSVTPVVQILAQDAPTGAPVYLGTDATNAFVICGTQTANFTAIPSNGGTTPSYSWSVNGSSAASTKDFAFSNTTPGTYQIVATMTSSVSCASVATVSSATYYVQVISAPVFSLRDWNGSVTIGNVAPTGLAVLNANPIRTVASGPNNGGATLADGFTVNTQQVISNPSMTWAVCNANNQNVQMTILQPINAGSNPTYQWQRNSTATSGVWTNVGVNNASFNIDNFLSGDQFRCVVTTSLSCASTTTATSQVITLVRTSVPTLTVTNNSTGSALAVGSTATFTITSSTGKFPEGTSFTVTGPSSPTAIPTLTAEDTDGIITYSRVIDAASKSGVYTFAATTPSCAASSAVNSTVVIEGDLIVSSNTTLSAGNYNSITVLNGVTATLGANTTVANYVVVNNGGTLDFNGFNIIGAASFTASSGSTLKITSAAGLTATGATGNVQSTGTRTYSSGAKYQYTGSVAQVTGAGITTANTIRVNNAAGVTISAALSVTDKVELVNGNLATGGFLTLVSTASKTAIIDNFTGSWTGTISGNVTAQQFIPLGDATRRFQVSPSVSGVTKAAYAPIANVNEFNEASNAWSAATSNGTVAQGTSVQVLVSNSQTLAFTGAVTTSNVTSNFVRSATSVAPFVAKGYNAFGNPFNAPISWTAVAAANTDAASGANGYAWVWNNGQYAVISAAGVATNGGNNNIAVGQGFLARRASTTGGATTTFTIPASARVSSTTNTFIRNTANNAIVRIAVSGANTSISDEVVVSADANASATSSDDAEKMFSNEETAVNAFISNNEGNFSFVATPAFENMGVATLNVVTKVAGVYTINPTEINGFNGTLMIEDRTSGKMVAFNKPFTFNSNGGTSRFYIHFTSNGAAANNSVDVFTSNGLVNVNFASATLANANIAVYNTAGQVVKQIAANGNTSVSFGLTNSNIYVVKVSTPEGIVSRKIFFSAK